MIALLFGTLRTATPLLFAGMGGMFSERGGVVNIALEGILLVGAFAAAAATWATGSAIIGVLAALLAGVLFSSLHALATLRFHVDQIVSGVALNLLAIGLTEFLMWVIFDSGSNSPRLETGIHAGFLVEIPPLTILVFLLLPLSSLLLFRTRFGLRLRSVGEHPEAAQSLGIPVLRMRLYGVLLSGAFAGLGGAFLSLNAHYFVKNMSAGRGFIALAALIFGKWSPKGLLAATLLFGFAEALQGHLHIAWLPVRFVQMFPYLITMVALAGMIGHSRAPAALGRPFDRG
ncbi:MAG: ABC transporter permease [Candidatus Krumholzibacteria bacterium]|jgi:simple sugar transport system permease protein|nr:ABC transporter permease [Candidatus Krumholzibacteria bacterium]MDP6669719.1 ABC transporter permease [Candidatus Krumholzibacteria bacterium]MDP6797849.1 ABC transporter permease [Candidatus Krumholzibacteria bacterium]MDP7021274.1 ABC transporter permease [Candidatus Krumholzibacteria bacterium]